MTAAKVEETDNQGNDNDEDDYNDERSREETDLVHKEGGEPRTSELELSRKASRKKTEELLKRACIGAPETERALEDKLKFLYWGDVQIGAFSLSSCALISLSFQIRIHVLT